MNFSKSTKLTKLLGLILVLCLMTTLFAGCMKDDSAKDTSEPDFGLNLEDETTTTPSETVTEPIVTEPTEINENMATVLSQMNVRRNPDADAVILGQLYAGDKVEIMRREEVLGTEWGYISEPYGGWIVMEFIQMDYVSDDPVTENTDTPAGTGTVETKPEEEEPSSTTNTTNIKGVISANGLNIRSEASTDGRILGAYNKGDVVTILETKDGWGRTTKGWVKMEFVSTSGSTGTAANTDKDKDKDNDKTTSNVTGNGSTKVVLKGVVNVKELNIRSASSTDSDRVGSYTYGTRVEILEKDGKWGRTSKGWIHLDYIYQDCTTGSNTASGKIIAGGGLRIRSGPGTNYEAVGTYAEGEAVNILEQFTFDGVKWGCTNKGWISMKYVDTGDAKVEENTSNNSGESTSTEEVTGFITANGGLWIRSGPGSEYETVGSLDYGDRVTITRQEKVGNSTWGKINGGWISMNYVDIK